jgi:hypothetical protein
MNKGIVLTKAVKSALTDLEWWAVEELFLIHNTYVFQRIGRRPREIEGLQDRVNRYKKQGWSIFQTRRAQGFRRKVPS